MTTLTFTDEQLVVLDRALGDLPYKMAAPLVASINEQIAAQRGPEIDRTPLVMAHHNPTDDAALARTGSD